MHPAFYARENSSQIQLARMQGIVSVLPADGQTKPSDQRHWNSALRHCSSVPIAGKEADKAHTHTLLKLHLISGQLGLPSLWMETVSNSGRLNSRVMGGNQVNN